MPETDWELVTETIYEAIQNAEGEVIGRYIKLAFEKAGIQVITPEDIEHGRDG